MPVGYWLSVAPIGWCTAFALAARSPSETHESSIAYWSSFLLNELPFIALYWLLAITALAYAQGDLASAGGLAGAVAAGLTAFGLLLLVWRALPTRSVTERALTDALGMGWRSEIGAPLARRLRHGVPWLPILCAPFLFRRRDVERIANISYASDSENVLDLYRQRARASGCPVLVHFHGGAMRSGRKSNEARPLFTRLASQGWVCLSAGYRLSPRASLHEQVMDAKLVLAWVREHGRSYGADPSTVFVAGSSAGGYLAALAALTANDPLLQPGFEAADTSVEAAIVLYGFYGKHNAGSDAPEPLANYVRQNAPPFFVLHGERDALVPARDARHFVDRLRVVSRNPVVYAELPGAQHTFDMFHSLRFESVVNAIEAFAAWVRSRPADV